MARKPKTVAERNNQKPQAGNRKVRRGHLAAKRAQKANPEELPERPDNSLFGKKRAKEATAEEGGGAAAAPKKKAFKPVRTMDPGAELQQKAARARKAARAAPKGGGGGGGGGAPPKPQERAVKPHMEAVGASKRLWERLRSERTPAEERQKLVDEVLAIFKGVTVEVLQKHDAARVLQSCAKHGGPAQHDALMAEMKGKVVAVARSHYGHHLLLSLLRHGSPAHKQSLLSEAFGHVAELVVHAEGAAVLQLLYTDVATADQRLRLYSEMWAREYGLFAVAAPPAASLAALLEAEPASKGRVLRRMEILLSKAARKGLAVTSLVQRGAADLLEHGEPEQQDAIVGSLREAAVHIMHTRDGARIACGCIRHGDAKDRKAILKAMKGYVGAAAQDAHGALVLCAALECVDDTVLLGKSVLSELCDALPTLATHAHGTLPLLQILAPRSPSYFTPQQLAILGGGPDAATSKKDPATRRDELLQIALPKIVAHCEAAPAALAASPAGARLFFEAAAAAAAGTTVGAADAGGMLRALAAAATDPAPAAAPADANDDDMEDVDGGGAGAPLLLHATGARLVKRLVQAHAPFARALLDGLRGTLADWAARGGGWVVLALAENEATADAARAELAPAARKLRDCGAAGCKKLAAAVGGGGGAAAAAAKPAAKRPKKAA